MRILSFLSVNSGVWPDRRCSESPLDAWNQIIFEQEKIMCHGSATSHLLTRGAVQLMNREIRAPKGEILPVPQASWRRNMMWHGLAPDGHVSSMDMPRQHRHKCAQTIASIFKRCVSPKFASSAEHRVCLMKISRVSIAKGRTLQKSRLYSSTISAF